MPQLKLSVKVIYKKAGSVLNVTLKGSYGQVLSKKATYALLRIALIRGMKKPGSPSSVHVKTDLVKKMPIGIEKNGSFSQDGSSTGSGPFTISKRISANAFHWGLVIVEVYNSSGILATEMESF